MPNTLVELITCYLDGALTDHSLFFLFGWKSLYTCCCKNLMVYKLNHDFIARSCKILPRKCHAVISYGEWGWGGEGGKNERGVTFL